MKDVGDALVDHALLAQAAQAVGLGLFGGDEDAGLGGSVLGGNFAELAQLDQAGVGVGDEVPCGSSGYGQGADLGEDGVPFVPEHTGRWVRIPDGGGSGGRMWPALCRTSYAKS